MGTKDDMHRAPGKALLLQQRNVDMPVFFVVRIAVRQCGFGNLR